MNEMQAAGIKAIEGLGYQIIPLTERQWNDAQTRALITTYKNHLHLFSNQSLRVREVWNLVSDELTKQGIKKSGNECDKKFRNLQHSFRKVYYDNERTESSKYQWDFYADLLEVMTSDKVLRRSKPIIASTTAIENDDNIFKVSLDSNDDIHTESSDLASRGFVIEDLDEVLTSADEGLPEGIQIVTEEDSSRDNEDVVPTRTYSRGAKRKATIIKYPSTTKRSVITQPEEDEESMHQNEPKCVLENGKLFEIATFDNETVEESQDDKKRIKFIEHVDLEEDEAPIWFQNFMISFETHTKLFQSKLNKIQETQEMQNTRLLHLSTKLQKIEKLVNDKKQ